MASINLSLNGAAIKNSYNKVLEGALPTGSPTSCLWALFSVQAPLVNAFQNSGSNESILKVQDSGGKHTFSSLPRYASWRPPSVPS